MDVEKYYQMASNQLKAQLDTIDVLNAKINTLLIVCGVFAVFFGQLASKCYYMVLFGLLFITGAMFLLLLAYRIVDWQNAPNVNRILYELNENKKLSDFLKFMTKEVVECYNENEISLNKKTKRINLASVLLTIGVFLSSIGMVTYLF